MQTPRADLRLFFRNILFTTDFSSASEAALPYVLAFARWYGSKVVVAHIVPPEPRLGLPLDSIPVAMDQNWQNAEQEMKRFLQSHPFAEVSHEFVVRRGHIPDAVSALVNEHGIDMLALGSHGREGIKKITLGSKAEQIFRTVICPVLTVGPNAAQQSIDFRTLKRILFATDFSSASLHALPYALSLAEENQSCLMLLHLVPLMPFQKPRDVEDSVRRRLRALVPPEASPWLDAEFLMRSEFPPEGILQVADERGADLIVIGVNRARSDWAAAHVPWEIAYEVVCQAHCPVLTVRASSANSG
jgi:nucleotide-binding universal stress UspA family protein